MLVPGAWVLLGPLAITSLRQSAIARGIADLATPVDPASFRESFGADVDRLGVLAENQTVTMARLTEIARPAPSTRPTPRTTTRCT